MRFYFSLTTGQRTNGPNNIPANETPLFIRRDAASIELQFYRGFDGLVTIVQLAESFQMQFGAKPLDSWGDSEPIVFTADFTWNEDDQVYRAEPSFNTSQLHDLFAPVEEVEPASIDLHAEFTWRTLDPETGWTTVPAFVITVLNDVLRGDEAAPDEADEPSNYVQSEELAVFLRTNGPQTISEEGQEFARDNINAADAAIVLTKTEQTLTAPEKAQVLENLGIPEGYANGVRYDEQALTDEQKLQARTNISTRSAAQIAADIAAATQYQVKWTAQTLEPGDQDRARLNINAAALNHFHPFVPRPWHKMASWNAVGNGTTITLEGALHTAAGTATTRNVSLLDAGKTVTAIDSVTDILTSTSHLIETDNPVQFTATVFPAPLLANHWYQAEVLSGHTLGVRDGDGDLVDITSEVFTALKIHRAGTPLARSRRIGFVSAATAGAACGTRHAALQFGGPSLVEEAMKFVTRFGISDAATVANARMFVGLAATTALFSNANPGTFTNVVGVGHNSGDANMHIIFNNLYGGTEYVDCGSDFPATAGTLYQLTIVHWLGYLYQLTLLNVAQGVGYDFSAASDPGMLMCPQHWRNNGSTALAVGLDVVGWTMESEV